MTASDSHRAAQIAQVIERVASTRLAGEELPDQDVISRHPDLMPELALELGELREVLAARRRADETRAPSSELGDRPAAGIFADAGAAAEGGPIAALADFLPGYRVTREIHRGGQGVVFQATQRSTRREVAIKIMREGPLASERERARFERESQILAQLKHPNIVTVHDSGVAAGVAYIVMDYIAGQPLDRHVAQDALAPARHEGERLRRRVELFAKTCEAVQAAHLRGVTHRDLKPGNILVDNGGEPHVVDFGLAKQSLGSATDAGSSAAAELTQTGQFVGSFPWASPEQAEGRADLDVRTDVYSLGVILYHLLTGEFPYRVTGTLRDVLERIVSQPPRRPRLHNPRLGDELETITLKCLAKDRERRYQTAGELARDLRRYLAGEAIEAKRDSLAYVARKLVARHRIPVAVALLFIATLVGATIGMSVYARRARTQADIAETQRGRAERQALLAERSRDLLLGVVERWDPYKGDPRRGVLRAAESFAETIQVDFAEQPDADLESALRHTLGEALLSLGAYDPARQQLDAALTLRTAAAGENPAARAAILDSLARLAFEADSDIAGAEALYQQAADLRAAAAPPTEPPNQPAESVAESLLALGELHYEEGRLASAARLFDRAAALLTEANPASPTLTHALNNQAYVLVEIGDLETAEALYRRVVERDRAELDGEHPYLATSLNNLGMALLFQSQPELATPLLEEAAEIRRKTFGDLHATTADSLRSLAFLAHVRGELEEGEALCRRALDVQEELFGAPHLAVAYTQVALAALLRDAGRDEEAEALYAQAAAAYVELTGEVHPLALYRYDYAPARLWHARGDLEKAQRLHENARDAFQELLGEQSPQLAMTIAGLAQVALDRGDVPAAETLARSALRMRRRLLGDSHPAVATSLIDLGRALAAGESHGDEAESAFERAGVIRRDLTLADNWLAAQARVELAKLWIAQRRFDEAEAPLIDALDALCDALGDRDPRARACALELSRLYEATGRPALAEKYRTFLPPKRGE